MSLWKRSEVSLNLTIEIAFLSDQHFWTGRSFVSRFCSLLDRKLLWERGQVVLCCQIGQRLFRKWFEVSWSTFWFLLRKDLSITVSIFNTPLQYCFLQKKCLSLKMVVFLFTNNCLKSGWCFSVSFSALAAQTIFLKMVWRFYHQLLCSCCSKMSLWKRSDGLLLNSRLLLLKGSLQNSRKFQCQSCCFFLIKYVFFFRNALKCHCQISSFFWSKILLKMLWSFTAKFFFSDQRIYNWKLQCIPWPNCVLVPAKMSWRTPSNTIVQLLKPIFHQMTF